MRRVMLLLGIGNLFVLCSGGLWLASRPPLHPLVPPDASDFQMSANGWWEWTLSYRTSRPLDHWYFPIVHQLEAASWTRRAAGYTGRPLPLLDPVAYERRTSFESVVLCERVELDGDLYVAHIRMRRWITFASLQ